MSTTAKNFHPLYSAMLESWQVCGDCMEGLRAIQANAARYLPPTEAHRLDGWPNADSIGGKNYQAYMKRAHFPDVFNDTVVDTTGVMYREDPTINLPKDFEVLLERASTLGESLPMLLRRIGTMQASIGRIGLLGDIEIVDGVPRPVLAVYDGRRVVNWDDVVQTQDSSTLRFVVLDESGFQQTEQFTWELKESYRVLALTDPSGAIVGYADPLDKTKLVPGVAASAVMDDSNGLAAAAFTTLNIQGQNTTKIPFAFINSADLSATPSRPPYEGLAQDCLTIYRGEADYRQSLHRTGQDTLVRIGQGYGEDGSDGVRIGSGATIDVPVGGDAKFIGINSQGIPEQRTCLENDYKRASEKASKVYNQSGQESGEALRIRVASQTATPSQMLKTACSGVESVLKIMAEWFGYDPDEVEIIPNTEFVGKTHDGQTLLQLVQAKAQGAPISNESIHDWMREQGFTDKTYEEEQQLIEDEAPAVGTGFTGGGTPGQPGQPGQPQPGEPGAPQPGNQPPQPGNLGGN